MRQQPTATLSAHLLDEAAKFFLYPNRRYRTKANLSFQEALDSGLRRLVDWRKTFAPQRDQTTELWINKPAVLDELYSRELLRSVPEIVERTRSLANITLSRASGESFVYLREAANCYIFGLPQAAVALSRAAIETPLRKSAAKQFGDKAVADLGLFALLELAVRGRILSKGNLTLAHKVRIAADRVLHEEPISTPEVLEIFEAARTVVAELTGTAGQ
jgi:hypothetical protein